VDDEGYRGLSARPVELLAESHQNRELAGPKG